MKVLEKDFYKTVPHATVQNKALVFNLIFASILFCLQLVLNIYFYKKLPISVTILNFINIALYLWLIIHSVIRFKQLETTTLRLQESKLYNKTLSRMNDNIRCFKHDFCNIVQSIGGYIQTEDIKGLKTYYSDLIDDCQLSNNLSQLNPNLINNPALYNLITSKFLVADSKGIKFNIDIFLDVNSIKMKTYELTRILGILLDNAIEAANELEEKLVTITFKMDSINNRQLIIIENSYSNKNIDIEKIFEKAYTTKENNTGLGLWEVRKILKKNHNINLFTSKNNTLFKQQLEIYV